MWNGHLGLSKAYGNGIKGVKKQENGTKGTKNERDKVFPYGCPFRRASEIMYMMHFMIDYYVGASKYIFLF